MTAVAVYLLNEEYKSISREIKNGMLNPFSYICAKTILVLPILFLFTLFAIGIPLFAIQSVPIAAFPAQLFFFTALFWVLESLAEFLSVAFEDAILGMLALTSFWFASFLFGGFMISLDNMNPPFNIFYYMLPFSYFMRSSVYNVFRHLTFAPCTGPSTTSVCIPETNGLAVLGQYSLVMPLFTTDNNSAVDLTVLLAMGIIYKLAYIIILAYKTGKYMQFHDEKKLS
jgi:ABC-2 type transporter